MVMMLVLSCVRMVAFVGLAAVVVVAWMPLPSSTIRHAFQSSGNYNYKNSLIACFDSDPKSHASSFQDASISGGSGDNNGPTGVEYSNFNKANRFSKFAPDANLPTEDFRAQLKENMKADLEKRRNESPNRGNQAAKSYLDSL